jgi:3-hydroxyisobutyrate dehydrogenase-like beta-hydroxyacid dehydrogenase
MNARPTAEPVTVLGLGAMGTALADAFLTAGHPVTVWNRTPQRARPLADRGATAAATPEDAVRASDLIVVCLLDNGVVDRVLTPAVAGALAGRTLVNLTNGTPAQARDLAARAAALGVAGYLDGGIMAVPPMIGRPGATVLYSGDATAFATHRETLARLAEPVFLGDDAGSAALHDIALLSGMYGMFGGALHALAMVRDEPGTLTEFTERLLVPWLTAMLGSLPRIAQDVENGPAGPAASPLAMQEAAYVNLLDASRDAGVRTDLLAPVGRLLAEAVRRGHGAEDVAGLFPVMLTPAAAPSAG